MRARPALTASAALLLLLLVSLPASHGDTEVLDGSDVAALGWEAPAHNREWVCREEDSRDRCDSWLAPPGFLSIAPASRVVACVCFLLWCLVGVEMVVGKMLDAMQLLTSTNVEQGGRGTSVSVSYWSATTANFGLVAVASCAPLIILAVVDTVRQVATTTTHTLGESAIVGSMAFNTLAGTAACVHVAKEARCVTHGRLLLETLGISLCLYVWVFVVAEWWGEGEVGLAEGLITLLAYPVIIAIPYLEMWLFPNLGKRRSTNLAGPVILQATVSQQGMRAVYGKDNLAALMSSVMKGGDDAPDLLRSAVQSMGGVSGGDNNPLHRKRVVKGGEIDANLKDVLRTNSTVGFRVAETSVREGDMFALLRVDRTGGLYGDARVRYSTFDFTAVAGKQYEGQTDKVLRFKSGEKTKCITIPIFDDDEVREEQSFVVRLHDSEGTDIDHRAGVTRVAIIDNDGPPGKIQFALAHTKVDPDEGTVTIRLIRTHGCTGELGVVVKTVDATAKGLDEEVYELAVSSPPAAAAAVAGGGRARAVADLSRFQFINKAETVVFADQEMERSVVIQLVQSPQPDAGDTQRAQDSDGGESDEEATELQFSVILQPLPQQGAAEGGEGGEERAAAAAAAAAAQGVDTVGAISHCIVTLVQDAAMRDLANRFISTLQSKQYLLKFGDGWAGEIRKAMDVDSAVDEWGQPLKPTALDCLFHFFALFWKTLVALLPPVSMGGGWPALFGGALVLSVIMAIVAELGSMVGCVIGVEEHVIGGVFLATGLSVPRLLATISALESSKDADIAVHSIIGANCAMLCLGFGLSWVVGASYHEHVGSTYHNDQDLTFATGMFVACAVLWAVVLGFKERFTLAGALGGVGTTARLCALLLLSSWVVFVVLISLNAHGHI